MTNEQSVIAESRIPAGKWVRMDVQWRASRRIRYMTRIRSGIVGIQSVGPDESSGFTTFGIGGLTRKPMPRDEALALALGKAVSYLRSALKDAETTATKPIETVPYYASSEEAEAAGELAPKDEIEASLVSSGWQPRWHMGKAENRQWFDQQTGKLFPKDKAIRIQDYRDQAALLALNGWFETQSAKSRRKAAPPDGAGRLWYRFEGEKQGEPVPLDKAMEILKSEGRTDLDIRPASPEEMESLVTSWSMDLSTEPDTAVLTIVGSDGSVLGSVGMERESTTIIGAIVSTEDGPRLELKNGSRVDPNERLMFSIDPGGVRELPTAAPSELDDIFGDLS